ncbi:hypothetical protein MKW92_045867, partial [Papaver armeniacum]
GICMKFGVEMASQASTTGVKINNNQNQPKGCHKNDICFPCNLSDDIRRTRLILKFGIVD